MKKIVLAIAAIITMTTSAFAQEVEQQGPQNGGRPDRAEMIKSRTEQTVTKYGLNEQQAQQLLELNTLYADSMRPQMGPRRGGDQNGFRPQREGQGQRRDGQVREGGRDQRMGGRGGQFAGVMERYNARLKAILTEEQMKAYEADQEQMRQQFGQRRPRRNN